MSCICGKRACTCGSDNYETFDKTVPATQETNIIPIGKGDDGDSAYQVAVNNGFIGTELEWLLSLVGPEGPTGQSGVGVESTVDNGDGSFTINYSDGSSYTSPDLTGPRGDRGEQGIQGEQGDKGDPLTWDDLTPAQKESLKGEKGEQGEQGPIGQDGQDGDDGLNGWTAITAFVGRGNDVVEQIVDWIGGEGTKPPVNQYIGESGWVTDINLAKNVRGARGQSGSGTGDMVAAIYDPNSIQGDVYNRANHTGTQEMATITGLITTLSDKVDKVAGKDLSDENFTSAEKSKLASITAIFTTALKDIYDSAATWVTTNGANVLAHLSSTSNPHGVTKAQVGLGSVDNTSDINKPISSATASALANKANTSDLASVATSGDYEDLNNKPTIPTQVNLIEGDNIEITGSYPNLTINASGGAEGTVSAVNTILPDISGNVTIDTDDVNEGVNNKYHANADWNSASGKAEILNKPTTFPPSAHNHSAADINSGTLNIARIPTGNSSSTVALGNDSRINNGQTAFGWGNHADAGYLLESDGIQTLSLGAAAGDIAISEGNSVSLSSLNRKNFNSSIDDFLTFPAGFHPYYYTTGSEGFPVLFGNGIALMRTAGTFQGSFFIDKANNNDNILRYAVGSTSGLGDWEIFASRSWVNAEGYLRPYTVPAILTANKTLSGADKNAYIRVTGTVTITMPADLSTTDYPIGSTTNVRVSTGATVNFVGESGVTLDHPDGVGNVSVEGRKVVSIVRVDTNAYDLIY